MHQREQIERHLRAITVAFAVCATEATSIPSLEVRRKLKASVRAGIKEVELLKQELDHAID